MAVSRSFGDKVCVRRAWDEEKIIAIFFNAHHILCFVLFCCFVVLFFFVYFVQILLHFYCQIHKHPFNGAPADHMSAEPHVDTTDVEDIEFMIVACDGLWDHFSVSRAL